LNAARTATPLYRAGLTGAGKTIVIVDSFGSPTIQQDLRAFDQAYGLPAPPSFNVITPDGPVNQNDPAALVWAALQPALRLLQRPPPPRDGLGVVRGQRSRQLPAERQRPVSVPRRRLAGE
jgi:hypothetical protein